MGHPELAPRQENPLDSEDNAVLKKISQCHELTRNLRARGLQDRGPPSHIRSEDVSEFQEPVLTKMPTHPTVAAQPIPTGVKDTPVTRGIVPHKMELAGADEDF